MSLVLKTKKNLNKYIKFLLSPQKYFFFLQFSPSSRDLSDFYLSDFNEQNKKKMINFINIFKFSLISKTK